MKENEYIFPNFQENNHDIGWFWIYCQRTLKSNCKRFIYISLNTLPSFLHGIFLQLT